LRTHRVGGMIPIPIPAMPAGKYLSPSPWEKIPICGAPNRAVLAGILIYGTN